METTGGWRFARPTAGSTRASLSQVSVTPEATESILNRDGDPHVPNVPRTTLTSGSSLSLRRLFTIVLVEAHDGAGNLP
jgi:hypothetical protein